MSLTLNVKQELVNLEFGSRPAMVAEIASMLRYAGALNQIDARTLIVEATTDSLAIAERLLGLVEEVYHYRGEISDAPATTPRNSTGFLVRWTEHGMDLARRTHLIDNHGRPVRGLPNNVILGKADVCAAAWRGAFLVAGSLTEPGRTCSMEIITSTNEAALALCGTARQLNVVAKTKESRGGHRVIVRDGDSVSAMLVHMGATETRVDWDVHRQRREVKARAHRLANFDDANLRRSARAAAQAAARVERALEILGDDVAQHLEEAGRLRITHRQASLEELGQLADPPMTKDAIAGRIRRLFTNADRRAAELGIPDTRAGIDEEAFDDEFGIDSAASTTDRSATSASGHRPTDGDGSR